MICARCRSAEKRKGEKIIKGDRGKRREKGKKKYKLKIYASPSLGRTRCSKRLLFSPFSDAVEVNAAETRLQDYDGLLDEGEDQHDRVPRPLSC